MVDHSPALEQLARMARERQSLLAGLLAIYQEQEELDEVGLAAFLEGDGQALTRLALCRRPRMNTSSFRSDVEQIATYASVNADQLARLVQAATSYEMQTIQGSLMPMTKHAVQLGYRRCDLLTIFVIANEADVEAGGRYDARGAAINIWTHGWHHSGTREESETMGTLYFRWGDERCYLREIECDEGFEKRDLLRELGVLEEKSLGRRVHGGE